MNAATIPRGREVPLTQEELGHLLGKSRQSIAKMLRLWEQDGIVQTRYGRVFIEKPESLAAMAYPDRHHASAGPTLASTLRSDSSLFKENL